MTIMQILGFCCSLLIGLVLGLMGGGGSMLTIPVLVYMLGISPVLSTAYSLFVVGITSLVGSVGYIRKQQVHYRAALLFAIPSAVTIFLTRRYLLPAIPDPIVNDEPVQISKATAFILLFAVCMLLAAVSMIADRKNHDDSQTMVIQHNSSLTILAGVWVGSLTGLAGIGGGFLIVPALVLLVRLSMKQAVGTSLLIIGINSLAGFIGGRMLNQINWPFLLVFTALAIMGILAGSRLSGVVPGARLRQFFGWSLLGISVCIITKEAVVPLVIGVNYLLGPSPRPPTQVLAVQPPQLRMKMNTEGVKICGDPLHSFDPYSVFCGKAP